MMSESKLNTLFIPESDPYYYSSAETRDFLRRIHHISTRHPVNVLVTGRQGCGKSSLVHQYAAIHRLPLATFQVGILSEPGQLFGEYTLRDGETSYQEFLFPQAIQTPNCVIHLEEINRPEHPKALNMLFSLLSNDRQVWLDELGLIKVAPGVVFFATLNEGDEYIGTELLDPALRDRFYVTALDQLPARVEQEILCFKAGVSDEQAQDIIETVNLIRSNQDLCLEVSTRRMLMIAEYVAAGGSVRDALISTLQADHQTVESILLSLHLGRDETRVPRNEYRLYNEE